MGWDKEEQTSFWWYENQANSLTSIPLCSFFFLICLRLLQCKGRCEKQELLMGYGTHYTIA